MQQYFIKQRLHSGARIRMDMEQAHHIAHVMRMRKGEHIRLADGDGQVFLGAIEWIDQAVYAQVLQPLSRVDRPAVAITLAQGLIRKERWDFLLQKCAELGVTTIQPFSSSRCVVKAKEERQDKKQQRWQRILQEACEQSRRATLAQIKAPVPFTALCEMPGELKLVAYEDADHHAQRLYTVLAAHPRVQTITAVVGCEGGFSLDEVKMLEEAGFIRVSLGPRILRAETAAMTMVDRLMFYYEEMAGAVSEMHGTNAD